ncbi:serine/threonine-protein kinase [Herpetosiphon gulosus]|uniref:non-specific serine/threonine protein kinase n=1 Tax=Herpetosiphon gulosus TaxID=1973496 RepID=A0ABP9X5B5_9CHLR
MQCPACGAATTNAHQRTCDQCSAPLPQLLVAGALVMNQYRVIQPLREGGTGQIYLAEDTRTFDRKCILKRTLLQGGNESRRMFATEAELLTRLRHPQIPQVFAYFEEAGVATIVMEYVAGRDLEHGLSHRLIDGTFMAGKSRPLEQVLRDAIVICKILEYLHALKPALVHGDIKPANLIRDRDSNELFLVDFGAAATSGVGQTYGTPGYAAPEQYRNQRYPASDIYNLAATIYHLLTDDNPCEHPLQFPKLTSLSSRLQQVLGRALHEDLNQRPNATIFRDLLEETLEPTLVQPFKFPSGVTPYTGYDLAQAIQADWGYGLHALVNGDLNTWLRQHQQTELAIKTHRMLVQNERPERVLDFLVGSLAPNLLVAEVKFEYNTVMLPLDGMSATPLTVTVRNRAAHIKAIDAPGWLQVGPPELYVVPEQPQQFQLGIDLDRNPRPGQTASVSFEIRAGDEKPQRRKLKIQLAQGYLPKPDTGDVWPLIAGLGGGAGMLSIMLAVAYHPNNTLLIEAAIGSLIGIIWTLMFSEYKTDVVLHMLLSIGGALLAGSIYAIYIFGAFNPFTLTAFFYALGGSLACNAVYHYFFKHF